MTQSMVNPNWTRHLFIFGMALALTFVNLSPVAADPEVLADGELDAVTARGVALPSFSYGVDPVVTTVAPFAPAAGVNDTDVKNIIFGFVNTTNVNTAVNTCVLSVCQNTGAAIESHPVSVNDVDVKNSVVPAVHNTISLPTVIDSNVGAAPAFQPASISNTQATAQPMVRHGLSRTRPALPTVSLGFQ